MAKEASKRGVELNEVRSSRYLYFIPHTWHINLRGASDQGTTKKSNESLSFNTCNDDVHLSTDHDSYRILRGLVIKLCIARALA